MGYRAKQKVLNWEIPNGWEASKEVVDILSHQGNANQNNPEISPHTSQIGQDPKLRWQQMLARLWERGTLLHCWWGCKMVQPLWKSVWQFLRKMDIVLPEDPVIQLLGIYPREAPTSNKETCSCYDILLMPGSAYWQQPVMNAFLEALPEP